jgi:hypothetical protein
VGIGWIELAQDKIQAGTYDPGDEYLDYIRAQDLLCHLDTSIHQILIRNLKNHSLATAPNSGDSSTSGTHC